MVTSAVRRALREERRAVSPIATELAKALWNLRRQWLPDDTEKETRLPLWRLLVAALGACAFFMLLGLIDLRRKSDQAAVIPWEPNVEDFISPLFDLFQPILWGLTALPFALLIYFQKGKGGPVSVFLGGVALPAFTFWIVRTATGD